MKNYTQNVFEIWCKNLCRSHINSFYIYTGCLVMNATKVFAYCIGSKCVPITKTCGKSLLYIGHFDIQRPDST
jgi:hypothetical protein